MFKNQDARNEDHINIDKTGESTRALQVRMMVAIQAVDGAAQQVQKLREQELYPQLLELLKGMGTMWRGISLCHQPHFKAVKAMKRLENSAPCKPTTSFYPHFMPLLELALNKRAKFFVLKRFHSFSGYRYRFSDGCDSPCNFSIRHSTCPFFGANQFENYTCCM